MSSLVASSVIAWSMVGIAFQSSFKGLSHFDAGHYEDAAREVRALGNHFRYLEYEPLTPSGWIRNIREKIADTGTIHQWITLAQLSMTFNDLNQEAEAYRSAHLLDPANDYLRAQYVRCLFDLGHRTQALEEIEYILTEDSDSNAHVFQALAHTRMGDLEEARKALVRACETGWSLCQIGALEIGHDKVIRYSMSDIPFASELEIGRTTLYHVVRLLESIGISVLYPPMHIGSTNISSPVDLDLLSRSVDYSRQEFLRVSGSNVSNHGRGYNLAVIDPHLGTVKAVGSFDTRLEIEQNRKLSEFIREVPSGYIVAGTINDEGSASLRAEGRDALREVGVARFPDDWWAHAFVGIKGAPEGSALEEIGERTIVALGILAGNMPENAAEGEIDRAVLQAAQSSRAGIAVYIEGLNGESRIVVGRVRS
jgi:tetratricopeptide (TPR) repeat protein